MIQQVIIWFTICCGLFMDWEAVLLAVFVYSDNSNLFLSKTIFIANKTIQNERFVNTAPAGIVV